MEEARRLENISVACPVSSHLCVPGDGGDVSDIGRVRTELTREQTEAFLV